MNRVVRVTHKRLTDFFGIFTSKLDRRRQKVLPQMLQALVLGGSGIVAEMARQVAADRFASRCKAFRKHLKSPAWSHEAAAQGWERHLGEAIEEFTPIACDLGDVNKEHARKMEGLAYVYDHDTKRIVQGYWMFESCAQLSGIDQPVPLLYFPYSVERAEENLSRNLAILRGLKRIREATQGRGLLAMDSEFDADVIFDWLLGDVRMHFVVHSAGTRGLCDASQRPLGLVWQILPSIPLEHVIDVKQPRNGKLKKVRYAYGYIPVRLPGQSAPLWLIASQQISPTYKGITGFLTDVKLDGVVQAERVLRAYTFRWRVEEVTQVMKEEMGLEEIRVKHWVAIERMVWLCSMAAAVLAFLYDEFEDLSKSTRENFLRWARIEKLKREVRFVYYRVLYALRGLAEGRLIEHGGGLPRDVEAFQVWKQLPRTGRL
jgi:hypothetical protein